jgi:hypothetical protein
VAPLRRDEFVFGVNKVQQNTFGESNPTVPSDQGIRTATPATGNSHRKTTGHGMMKHMVDLGGIESLT